MWTPAKRAAAEWETIFIMYLPLSVTYPQVEECALVLSVVIATKVMNVIILVNVYQLGTTTHHIPQHNISLNTPYPQHTTSLNTHLTSVVLYTHLEQNLPTVDTQWQHNTTHQHCIEQGTHHISKIQLTETQRKKHVTPPSLNTQIRTHSTSMRTMETKTENAVPKDSSIKGLILRWRHAPREGAPLLRLE